MGGRSSKEGSYRQNSSSRSSSSWGGHPGGQSTSYAQPPYGQGSQSYPPPPQESYQSAQPYYAPVYSAPAAPRAQEKTFDRRYSRIADNYHSLEEVTEALLGVLVSSLPILSLVLISQRAMNGQVQGHLTEKACITLGTGQIPHEHAISIIGKTLAAFDEDNLIPCFGFGDATTHDQDVFSFYDDRYCNGFEEVLARYKEIVPKLRLAGPTSFAPVIEQAMTIVEESAGQYHVLLIIADGQVTRSIDTENGRLSPQEQNTVNAIVAASKLPLSIILVGVGDGPWDMMKEFDDNIPARAFDNFQFVNFTQIMSKNVPPSRKETEFALAALMEIPAQYKATIELNILGGRKGNIPQKVPLPPPVYGASSFSSSKTSRATSFSSPSFTKPSHTSYEPSVPPYYGDSSSVGTAPPAPSSTYDNQVCPICLTNPKDMAFGCGHQTCCECGQDLQSCPICRSAIQTRIKLY